MVVAQHIAAFLGQIVLRTIGAWTWYISCYISYRSTWFIKALWRLWIPGFGKWVMEVGDGVPTLWMKGFDVLVYSRAWNYLLSVWEWIGENCIMNCLYIKKKFLDASTSWAYPESLGSGRCLDQVLSLVPAKCNFLERWDAWQKKYLAAYRTGVSIFVLVIGVHKGVDLVLVGRRSNLMWMLPNIEISFLAIAEALWLANSVLVWRLVLVVGSS